MFERNYKNAMDNITPDADVKDKILDRIILKEELKERKNSAIPWRVAFACVACLAIILGIVFVPRDSFKTATRNPNAPQTLQVSSAGITYSSFSLGSPASISSRTLGCLATRV